MPSSHSRHHTEHPHFQCWNLASPNSGLRLFQGVGSLIALFLIASVGSHFSPTYAVLLTCTGVSIVSPVLVIVFSFNLHKSTEEINWILWELIYTSSGAFLFFINSITMSYSSIRWDHIPWYLGAVLCVLICASFFLDSWLSLKVLSANPFARHSHDNIVKEQVDDQQQEYS